MRDLEKYRRGHHGLATRRTLSLFPFVSFSFQSRSSTSLHVYPRGVNGVSKGTSDVLQGYNELCVVVGAFHFVGHQNSYLCVFVFGLLCFSGMISCVARIRIHWVSVGKGGK